MTLRHAALAAALAFHPTARAADGAAAGELARIVAPRATWSAELDGLARLVAARMQAHPGASLQFPADFEKTVRAELEKVLPYETTLASHARELAAAFTEPELKELVVFFKTPTGSKWLQSAGEVQARIGLDAQRRLDEKLPDIQSRLVKLAKAPPRSKAPAPMPAGHPATGGPAEGKAPEPSGKK